jgi:hypothetical protein
MNPPKTSDGRNGTDPNPRRSMMALTLIAGTCAAALPVLAVVVLLLSRNPQLDQGLNTTHAFSLAIWLTLAASALWGLVELAQPGGARHAWSLLLPAPMLLGGGVAYELARTPPSGWTARIVGSNPAACFTLVTLFSLPILTSLFYVLRSVTLASPRCAGALAGLLASSVAAAIYVWHCPTESLLYIAAWHGSAVIVVGLLGAMLGKKYLRDGNGLNGAH